MELISHPSHLLRFTAFPLPTLFFVSFSGFSPEIVGIAKRIALLPRDATRVINGLLHLPVDTMRAIAVLDDPAEVEGPEITTGAVIPMERCRRGSVCD